MISMDAKRFNVRWKVHKDLTESCNFSDHCIIESLINLNPIVIDIPDRITWNFNDKLIDVYNGAVVYDVISKMQFFPSIYLPS